MTTKCDVTIAKSMTIPTSMKFSSIKPSVSVTVKDVNLSEITSVSKSLEVITSGLLIHNIKEDMELMDDVDKGVFADIDMNYVDQSIEENAKKILKGDDIPF